MNSRYSGDENSSQFDSAIDDLLPDSTFQEIKPNEDDPRKDKKITVFVITTGAVFSLHGLQRAKQVLQGCMKNHVDCDGRMREM